MLAGAIANATSRRGLSKWYMRPTDVTNSRRRHHM